MSIVAEYAASLHHRFPPISTQITPQHYPARTETITDIQAVIFDVYGTLIHYWNDSFSDPIEKQQHLLRVFRQCADEFAFTPILESIDPKKAPEETLYDFYHGLILMKHEQHSTKNYPEVQIDEIWNIIVSILINNGYDLAAQQIGTREEFSRCIAYFYHFHSLGRAGFFPGAAQALKELREQNIRLGILSNAQFYTPIDLTLFLRSENICDDYLDIFDSDLCFFSYEYSIAKPNPLLYRRLFDALYEVQILPSQTLFVGNDLSTDVLAAQEISLKTALFTGNHASTFLHDLDGKVTPDISFSYYSKLPKKVSFHTGTQI